MCFTAGWYGLGEKDALLHVPPRPVRGGEQKEGPVKSVVKQYVAAALDAIGQS
jgi:hypothetical protein